MALIAGELDEPGCLDTVNVLWDPYTIVVDAPQGRTTPLRVSLVGSKAAQLRSLGVVLQDHVAVLVPHPEVALRIGVPLLLSCGTPMPFLYGIRGATARRRSSGRRRVGATALPRGSLAGHHSVTSP